MNFPFRKFGWLGIGALVAAGLLWEGSRQERRLQAAEQAVQVMQAQNQSLAAKHPVARPAALAPPIAAARASVGPTVRQDRDDPPPPSDPDLQPFLKPVKDISFEGQATPVATIDSTLYAIYHGDVDQLGELLHLTQDGKAAADALFAQLPPAAQAQVQSPEKLTALLVTYSYDAVAAEIVDSRADTDPGTWKVKAIVESGDGHTHNAGLDLVNQNGSWQISVDAATVGQFSKSLNQAIGGPVSKR